MKSNNANPTVWGVFVGENGEQLEVFNSKSGPFPPDGETEGYIAIGWPAIGDIRMFQNNYTDFVDKFRVIYPEDSERVFKTKANMPWYFAFSIQRGDWIISPCSSQGLLLVGEIVGDYETDFHNKFGLYGRRPDFVHLRKVLWKYIIPQSDPRYGKLNRIGQLTVSRPHITFDELQSILQTHE